MNIKQTPNQAWQWSELDPLTRSVLAAFSWSIGEESEGHISQDGFVEAMAEAFDSITTEDVVKTAEWNGPEGIRNTIINKLSGFEAENVLDMTQQLGQLAGGSEALVSLATQTGEVLQVRDSRIYDAIPALRVLSELAIANR